MAIECVNASRFCNLCSYLNLCENALTGPIPREVGLLKKLTGLGLGSNKLTGKLLCQIYPLTSAVLMPRLGAQARFPWKCAR